MGIIVLFELMVSRLIASHEGLRRHKIKDIMQIKFYVKLRNTKPQKHVNICKSNINILTLLTQRKRT